MTLLFYADWLESGVSGLSALVHLLSLIFVTDVQALQLPALHFSGQHLFNTKFCSIK